MTSSVVGKEWHINMPDTYSASSEAVYLVIWKYSGRGVDADEPPSCPLPCQTHLYLESAAV